MSYTTAGENREQAQTDALEAAREDSLDTVFTVLSDQRRRYILDCLDEYDTPMALNDLAEEVAVREYDSPITEISVTQVKEVSISLHHVHVPRMEDAGLVEYERDDNLVALSEDGQEVIEAHDL